MLKRLPISPGHPKANLARVNPGKQSTAERLGLDVHDQEAAAEVAEQPHASSSAREQQWGQSWEENQWEAHRSQKIGQFELEQKQLWQQHQWDEEERHQKRDAYYDWALERQQDDVNTSIDSANSPPKKIDKAMS